MKNTIKAWIGLTALAISNVALAVKSEDSFRWWNQATQYDYGWRSLPEQINTWLGYLTSFTLLVAVVIGLWWAFNILTAAWDEEKVKTWKSIILRAVFWIIAIFSIYMIMSFVISSLFTNK